MTWRGDPLPRGRHKLSSHEVATSQRERLLRAMLELVAEHGYSATTVPQVVDKARVSRSAFYAQFTDKTDCFLAVCDQAATEILAELTSLAAEPDWLTAQCVGTTHYLRWWQERPEFARAYFAELPLAGARAMEQRERQFVNFRAMFRDLARRARAEQPDLPELGPLTDRVIVAAVTELIAEEVRAGRGDRLVELSGDLCALVVRLLADDATAARVEIPAVA